jgi:hypothetical protein
MNTLRLDRFEPDDTAAQKRNRPHSEFYGQHCEVIGGVADKRVEDNASKVVNDSFGAGLPQFYSQGLAAGQ